MPDNTPSSTTSPLYRTTDFYLACYLLFMEAELARIEAISPSRVVFVFAAVDERRVLDYYNHASLAATHPKADDSFLSIVDAIRHTRELLYNALENAAPPQGPRRSSQAEAKPVSF